MSELKGIEYLRQQLELKRPRVLVKYSYYNKKETSWKPSAVIPDNLKRKFKSSLGWCGTAVDAIVNRLVYDGIEDDFYSINDIFSGNNPGMFFRSAIQGALVSSCSFIYISKDGEGKPRLQVIDGGNATGRYDVITGMLLEGYAVLERDEYGNPEIEAYFTPDATYFIYSGKPEAMTKNDVKYPYLVPVVFKPDAERPFGHSRITRTCMIVQDAAKDVITRSDITAEFYSFPQKYILGLSQDAEKLDSYKALISSFLSFTKDEDGEKPVVGQFQQQSMTPHIEQLKMYASIFAAETGLTLDDLGFVSDNPSSADAIKASRDALLGTIEDAKITFSTGFLNAGFIAACIRDGIDYDRQMLYRSRVLWKPSVRADAASLSGVGDAINKIKEAFPNYITEKKIRELTGI